MARIRTIKPEFWRSEKLAKLPEFTRLVAIAILNVADDEGFFFADPRLIRGEVFPFEDDYRRITVALRELSGSGYVAFQTHSEKGEIGRVENFASHQVINKRSPSKIRKFFEESLGNGTLPEDYGSTTGTLLAGTGNREQGKEQGEGKEVAPIFQDSDQFQELWRQRVQKHFETQGQRLSPMQADAELMQLSRRGLPAAIKDLESTILKGYGRTICEHDKFESKQPAQVQYEPLQPRKKSQ